MFSGDTEALVSVLEQLTHALKSAGKPKALGEGTEELVEDVEGGEDSGEVSVNFLSESRIRRISRIATL